MLQYTQENDKIIGKMQRLYYIRSHNYQLSPQIVFKSIYIKN